MPTIISFSIELHPPTKIYDKERRRPPKNVQPLGEISTPGDDLGRATRLKVRQVLPSTHIKLKAASDFLPIGGKHDLDGGQERHDTRIIP
jgi:hypothetical protein